MNTLHQYQKISDKEAYFNSKIIASIDDLKELKQEKDIVFRGVNNAYYSMYSSFQRFCHKEKWYNLMSDKCREKVLKKHISQVRKDICNVGLNIQTLSDYNILALMQHYELPTTLLDFSTDFEVALSFALMKDEGKKELPDYVSLYTLPSNDDNLKCSLPNQAARNAAVVDAGIFQLDEYTRNNLMINAETITANDYNTINDYRLIKGGLQNIRLETLGLNMIAGNNNPNRERQCGLYLQTPFDISQVEVGFYEKYNTKITSYEIPSSLEDGIKETFQLYDRNELYSNSEISCKIKEILKMYK